jgi:hypothetical protein
VAIEVDAAGSAATAPDTVEARRLDGAVTVQGRPFDGSDIHLEVEPMVPSATPTIGTPSS